LPGLTLYELLALRPAIDGKERHRLNRQVPRDLVTTVHAAGVAAGTPG
jgi:hypothetical protein